MIRVTYTEMDGPEGLTCRLEAAGHAGYAPLGQDIVCAGASTLMQTLVYLLAEEEGVTSDAWDEPDGPRLTVTAAPPVKQRVEDALEFAKAGFVLLAERYPEYVRFADQSRRGTDSMMELQLFAEGEGGAEAAPALSPAQERQAIASGTMKPEKAVETVPTGKEEPEEAEKATEPEEKPEPERPEARDEDPPLPELPRSGQKMVELLHRQWAAEEAALRQENPAFSLRQELQNPEMRRLMQLPGMRMKDAYRLAHYEDTLRQTAQTVEKGVMERIQQRASRPSENGTRPGGAAVTRADVEHMTRAQREALEQQALHGANIRF